MPTLPCPESEELKAIVALQCSRRGKILKAIELLLETVLKKNGYKTNICKVSFDVRMWQDVTAGQTPAVFTIDGPVDFVRHASRVRFATWQIGLFGVVKELNFFEFEDFIGDLKEMLETNSVLLGTVNKIEVANILTDNQLFSQKDGTHLFNIETQAEFKWCHGDR